MACSKVRRLPNSGSASSGSDSSSRAGFDPWRSRPGAWARTSLACDTTDPCSLTSLAIAPLPGRRWFLSSCRLRLARRIEHRRPRDARRERLERLLEQLSPPLVLRLGVERGVAGRVG